MMVKLIYDYAQPSDIYKKILGYYSEVLLEDVFPIKNTIRALFLEQMEKLRFLNNTISKKQIILDLELNIFNKIQLITEIYAYYSMAGDKIQCKEYAQIQKELSSLIEDPFEKEFYIKLADINELLADEKRPEARKMFHELAAWCESCKQNPGAKPDEIDKIVKALRAIGNLIDFQYKNPDEFFKDLLGKEAQEQIKPYYSNKIFQLGFTIATIEEMLVLKKYDELIEVGLECIKKFEDITEDDKKEFQKIVGTQSTSEEFINIIKYGLKFDLGLSYLVKGLILKEKENFDKDQVKSLLENAMKFLEDSKEDQVRGQYYDLAKLTLDQLN